MAGLQRSAVSFRRQGSSGLVFDDKFLSGELNQLANRREESKTSNDKDQRQRGEESEGEIKGENRVSSGGAPGSIDRSRSNGGGRYRTGRVSPAIEPPSPRVSACGFCGAFKKHEKSRRPPKVGKRKI